MNNLLIYGTIDVRMSRLLKIQTCLVVIMIAIVVSGFGQTLVRIVHGSGAITAI